MTAVEPPVCTRDFESFFAGAYARVLAQLIALCGNREDAEDVAQEAFVEAYRAWDRIAGYELPEAWVHRVAVQRLWKTERKRRTGRDRLPEVSVPAASSPEQTAEALDVLRLLMALPPQQRLVTVLFCLHGWSQKEIAGTLHIRRGTVAAHVNRARRTLREALAPDGRTNGRCSALGTGDPHRGAPGSWWDDGECRERDRAVAIALRTTVAWLRSSVTESSAEVARARAVVARRSAGGR
ncbi:RNA polymerase sigma factor [Streptomyces sp. LE64]|uniref:RNA polymerase sigma factor n=1 Tax=Streptomyces sp. LE64 TaxID=3448653 RepID=UPI0040437B35